MTWIESISQPERVQTWIMDAVANAKGSELETSLLLTECKLLLAKGLQAR